MYLESSAEKDNNTSLIPLIAPIVQHQTLALQRILHNLKMSELPSVLLKDVSETSSHCTCITHKKSYPFISKLKHDPLMKASQ